MDPYEKASAQIVKRLNETENEAIKRWCVSCNLPPTQARATVTTETLDGVLWGQVLVEQRDGLLQVTVPVDGMPDLLVSCSPYLLRVRLATGFE